MYVNDWTLDFGARGREAVTRVPGQGHAAGVLPELVTPEFVELDRVEGMTATPGKQASSTLDRSTEHRAGEMVALRRHLHAHPEPSGEELQTSLHLYQLFDEPGCRCGWGRRAAAWSSTAARRRRQQRIAVRADIDALRIQDQKPVAYRSTCREVMHACGHDAHTATVFGALSALDALGTRRRRCPGRVTWRGIFQPAEETGDGAAAMIAAGALEGVDAIFALHVDPTRRAGTIGVRPACSPPVATRCA